MSAATAIDRDRLEEEVKRQKARRQLIAFAQRLFPDYQASWHHFKIAAFLHRAETVPGFRGVLIVPPRFGKSELASVNFPPFYLGRNPTRQMIAASHTAGLAYDFSRQARNKIEDPDYPFPEVTLADDAAAVQQWEVESPGSKRRGKYVAVGVGGSPTGKGADIFLVDDAVKNRADADSEAMREFTWQWFRGTAATRLQPGGSIVVIGTRWHHDDLIGRILQNDIAHRWEVLHLPARLGNGSSLWPEMWSEEELALKEAEVGARDWQAQYQGNPTPEEGEVLRVAWFGRREGMPADTMHLIQSWDTAFKTSKKNDYSVCTTWAVTPWSMYLVDVWRDRLEYPDLERKAIELWEAWPGVREVLIEDKASGQSLIQSLRRDPRKIPVVPIPTLPGDGKVKRAHDITPFLEGGRVFLPLFAPWLERFTEEVKDFPLGTHDDQVDSMTQALARVYLPQQGAGGVASESYLGDPDDAEDDEEFGFGPFGRGI